MLRRWPGWLPAFFGITEHLQQLLMVYKEGMGETDEATVHRREVR